MNYNVRTPVVLLVFNRPEPTKAVFERIRAIKPSKLYIVADGPRAHVHGEAEACQNVRGIFEQIDWECTVQRNYAVENMGLKNRVSSGLNWVFEQEEEAIVIEDDCVPAISFFRYCDEMLEKYKNDERIMMVAGSNLMGEWESNRQSYHFSKDTPIWGWATWRRSWKHFDLDMKFLDDPSERVLERITSDDGERTWANLIIDKIRTGKINSWAYPWHFSVQAQSGLTIIPSVNLVSNIGFDDQATHTKASESELAGVAVQEMKFPIKDNPWVVPDKRFDMLFLNRFYRPPIVCFGASDAGNSAYWLLRNKYRFLYYCDNNPSKWGAKLNGIEIISPEQLKDLRFSFILIASIYFEEIANQLEELGIRSYKVYRGEVQ